MENPSLPQLSLFGPVALRCRGRELQIKSLKLRAILGYVALSEALLETRERLVGLLWSESEEANARGVLRQVIRELRQVFAEGGCGGLRITAQDIGFEQGAIEVDVWLVIRAAEQAEVHPLLLERQHLADDLLAGLEDLDPSFRIWVLAKREALRERLLRSLEKGLARIKGDPRKECDFAEAIINLDPTHEEACRRLMRAHAEAGRITQALRVYKTLWDLLDEEYDMEPSTATQQLVAEIKMGSHEDAKHLPEMRFEAPAVQPSAFAQLASVPASGTLAPLGPHEIRLVLSLQAMDVSQIEPGKTHIVLGFRQLLLASLVKFREWHVTDAPFEPAGAGAQQKDARYEIQMYAYQVGQIIQLTLMLKELDSGFFIWSDGFELSLDTWFASQRRIIRRIAMALNVHLSADRLRRLSEQPDISVGLYDKWLRCQTLVRTFAPQHWTGLAKEFDEIIAAAPQFVPAYCGLADMNTIKHIAHPGVFRTREREDKALALARKAVELDAADMNAHRCLAWANAMTQKFGQAETHIQIACELNPNDSWTAISAALLLAFCGDYKRACELGQAVQDLMLSPVRTHWVYQVDIQFLSGNYTAALEAADMAQDALWGVAAWRTATLAQLGRTAEAADEGARFLSRARANWYGPEPATDENIVRWLLHLYPIRHRADWERLRDGLKAAGLPTGTSDHGALSAAV